MNQDLYRNRIHVGQIWSLHYDCQNSPLLQFQEGLTVQGEKQGTMARLLAPG